MAQSLGFRLVLATLVAGLAATPALAAKKKGKKKAKTEAASESEQSGARVAGPAPPAKHRRGKATVRGPGGKKATGKRKGKRPGAHRGKRRGPSVRGPKKGGGPRSSGAQATAKPRIQAGPHSPSKQRAEPRAQGASPRIQASGPRAQGSKPRAQGASPRLQGSKPRTQARPGAQAGSRMQAGKPGTTSASTSRPNKPKRVVQVEQSVLRPSGWNPRAHRYHLKDVPALSAENLGAGVFMYNPPPTRHRVQVVEKNPITGSSTRSKLPSRDVNRAGSFAVGIKGGTLVEQEAVVNKLTGDTGYGIVARYRPVEAIGFEGSWMRHEDASSGTLVRDPLSVSAQLFAFPWTRLSPYVGGGVTFDGPASRADAPESGRRMMPHAGLGVELALGRSLAIDIEGRYLSQMQTLSDDPLSEGGALQATAGLLFHF